MATWRTLLGPRTRSRLRYLTARPAYVPSNVNDDHGRPAREDCSVLLLPAPAEPLEHVVTAPRWAGPWRVLRAGTTASQAAAWRTARSGSAGTAAAAWRVVRTGAGATGAAAWRAVRGGTGSTGAASWRAVRTGGATS